MLGVNLGPTSVASKNDFERFKAMLNVDLSKESAQRVPTPTVGMVVPAMNEARNLPYILNRIPHFIDEVILVDGASTDDTVEVAQTIRPDIKIVDQCRKGKGAALKTGFAACKSDIIIMIDADGSMDPVEISAFVGALHAGADFVKGSRFMQGGGTDDMEWYRRLGNWGFTTIVNLRFGSRFSDLCYGYIGFWRESLDQMALEKDDGFEIETSLNIQALTSQLRVHEVPSIEAPRIHGVSNLRTFPDGWRVLKTILRLGLKSTTKPREPKPIYHR